MLGLQAIGLAKLFFDGVGDRERLARGRAVADDEVVGEVAEPAEVQDQDVFRLLVDGGFDDVLQDGSQRVASRPYRPWR
jgi:hypothetical protein